MLSIALVEILKSLLLKLINPRAEKGSSGVMGRSKTNEMNSRNQTVGEFSECIFTRRQLHNIYSMY